MNLWLHGFDILAESVRPLNEGVLKTLMRNERAQLGLKHTQKLKRSNFVCGHDPDGLKGR